MKKLFYQIILPLLFLFLLQINSVFAATYYSKGTGNWSNPSNWGTSCGAGTGAVPSTGDDIVICSGHVMTLDVANVTIGNLTINNTATLEFSSSNFIVTGVTTINTGGSFIHNSDGNRAIFNDITNDGTFTTSAIGSFQFTFKGNITNTNIFNLQNSSQSTFDGSTTIENISSSDMRFSANNSGALVINTSKNVIISNTTTRAVIMPITSANGVIVDGSFTNNSSYLTVSRLLGTGSFTNTATATTIHTSSFQSTVTTFTNSATSTFEYNYGGNGSIRGEMYGNLIINGSNIKTLSATTSIAGNLTITNATLDIASNNLTANGITTVNGTGQITSSGGILSFPDGSTYIHDRNGGVIPTATWGASSTCTITGITTTGATGLNQTFGHFTCNSPAQTTILDINGSMTVLGNLKIESTGTGSFGGLSSFTLNLGGNLTRISGNFAQGTNSTVIFNGSAAQFIEGGFTFHNLEINNSMFSDIILNSSTLVVVSNTLTLTSGKLILGANDLTLSNPIPANQLGGSFDNTKYIVTYGGGNVKYASSGSLFYPIGTTSQYAPISINTGSTNTTARVTDDFSFYTPQPSTPYLGARWITNSSSVPTGITFGSSVTCIAPSQKVYKWTGSAWDNTGITSGCPVTPITASSGLTAGGNEYAVFTTPTIAPQGNRGLYFDGFNDYVTVNDNPSLNPTTAITVEAWIKPSKINPVIPTTPYNNIVSKENFNRGYALRIGDGGKVDFGIYTSSGLIGATTTTLINLNQWTHVVGVYDGTNVIIYVNGIQQAISTGTPSTILNSSTELNIGKSSFYLGREFAGQIDEVRIFGSARIPTQIVTDMASTTLDGAAAFWRFEELNGQTIQDEDMVTSINGVLGTSATAETQDPLRALRVINVLNDASIGSLGWAIAQSNLNIDKNYIDFSIPTASPWQIDLNSNLDIINNPVIIDGTSQFGWNTTTNTGLVRLNNTNLSTTAIGLNINANNTEIYGLELTNFKVSTFPFSTSIYLGFNNTRIGAVGKPNVINNTGTEVAIRTSTNGSITGLIIEGNRIGTNVTGTAMAGSNDTGIRNYATGTKILNNLISGMQNGNARGIENYGNDLIITGNQLGTDLAGTGSISNGTNIILQSNAGNCTIGGALVGEGNIIANATNNGISVTPNSINNKISRNSIYNNTNGINLIGTFPTIGNNGKEAPFISSITLSTITGTCEAGDMIEIFENNSGETQGRTFVQTLITIGTNWTYTGTLSSGKYYTAIATDNANGSSSFSNAVEIIPTYYSRQSTDWNVLGTWSTVSLGDTDCNCTPPINAEVVIGTGYSITTSSAISPSTLTLAGTLDLGNVVGGHILTTTTITNSGGAGRLKIGGSNTAPSIATTSGNFFTTAGNVVEFYGNSSYNAIARDYPTINITDNTTLSISTGSPFSIYGNIDVQAGSFFNVFADLNFPSSNTIKGVVRLGIVNVFGNTEILASSSTTIQNVLTINNGATLTNSGALQIDGSLNPLTTLTGTGNFIANPNSSLMYGSDTAIGLSSSNFNVNTNNNVVIYTAGASPLNTDYKNLMFRNSRATTAGTLTAETIIFDNAGVASLILGNGTNITTNTLINTNPLTSTINFGTGNAIFTVMGDMQGGTTLDIIHNPSITVNQLLDLKGTTNIVRTFTCIGTGNSTVRYSGTNQNVFPSADYKNVEITGGGIKTLQGNTTINNSLILTNGKINLNTSDLLLATPTTTITGGNPLSYVITSGTRKLTRNGSATGTFLFPVGDAFNYKPFTLTAINTTSVRYINAPTSPSIPAPFYTTNGLNGMWEVTGLAIGSTDLKIDNPQGNTSSSSVIRRFIAGNWIIVPTNYNSSPYYQTNPSIGVNPTDYFAVLTGCPSNFTFNPSLPSLPNGTVGTLYNQTISATGGTSPYTYSLSLGNLPTGTTLNTSTGQITGTPTLAATYNFTIQATDANACVGSESYSITIVCPTITFTPPSLPNGTAGTAYNQTISTSGGTSPYTYSLSLGNLPTGTTLNTSTGQITGTPTLAATYNFTIQANDANACVGSENYSITIVCPTITVSAFSDQTLCSGSSSPAVTLSSNLSGATFVWSAVAPNISSSPTLSGNTNSIPAELLTNTGNNIGTLVYTITPSLYGCTGTPYTYTITVNPNPVITLSVSSPTICIGTNATFTVDAGFSNYEFRLNTANTLQTGNSNTYSTLILQDGDVIDVIVTSSANCTTISNSITMNVGSQLAPTLVQMPDFVRNTNPARCHFINQTSATQLAIPNGQAAVSCGSVLYEYSLSGATNGIFSNLQGIQFNQGITRVSWLARNVNNATSTTDEFLITIRDTQIPIIQAPTAITRTSNLYSCTLDSIGIDLGRPIASDNCLVRVFNDAPIRFSVGQTTVIWTAIDSAGNRATANQLVTITEQFYVSPSDSLVLVDMYNQMGGQNWIRSWDLNRPVSTWSGINVNCGKIILINLSSNNLTGILPTSVLNLAQRNDPNFSLNISGNRLSFESAENFVGLISNFIYSPQAKIYVPSTQTIRQSQSITFNSQTEGNFTVYQWYKNQVRINGANSPTFTLTNALPSDAGIYVCEIKNTVATQLTLERNPITLIVEGFLSPTDSLALVAIFEETGGTNWTPTWDLTQPVATWEGVTLSGNKLIELDLSSHNLTGRLPNVFDADLFSELRYLSFFDNHLEGQIPATIGNITTLTYLDLDKNNFEGSVPVSFGNLSNLQALWLSRNNLTELPNEIGNLRNLKNLYLNDNKFTSLPATIGNLSELLVLNVSDNELSELPNSITNLRKLVEFYANRNLISVLPTGIQNLIALTVFEMNTNNLSSLDLNLLQLPNLRTLRIAENKLEFDDLLPFVSTAFTIFDYAPQAPINEEMDVLKPFNSSVTFNITTQGNGNKYQWLQNGNPVSTLQNFTINRVQNTDAGLYTALITNISLPNLTLQRRSIRLNVECQAGQYIEINQPQQTLFCKNQPFGLKLEITEGFDIISQIRWKKDGIIVAFANEKTYTVTQKGIYTAEILTENGCTILSNTVEIKTLPNPEVTISLENEKILTSTINSQETVTYQWLKDGNVIENGFENSYIPTQTGEYNLLVLTEAGCSSISQTIIFTADEVTGINEPKEFRNLSLYPNPNNGTFFIDFGTNSINGEVTFTLIDAIGRKLNLKTEKNSSTRYNVKTNNLAGGIYQLQIQTKDGITFRKFVIEE